MKTAAEIETYYNLLGLSGSASLTEVQTAYDERRKALEESNAENAQSIEIQMLNEAYHELSLYHHFSSLVTEVNAYPLGIDKSILVHYDSEEVVLYPCSGADATHLFSMFPRSKMLVFLDAHLFFGKKIDIEHQHLALIGKKRLSKGYGYSTINSYDHTEVHNYLSNTDEDDDKFRFEDESIGSLFLLRLRKLCGMTLESIHEEVPGCVYTIMGHDMNQQEKTIHYVNSFLGEQSAAYDWLKAQRFPFDALLLKAFVPSIDGDALSRVAFDQIKALMELSVVKKENQTIVSDVSPMYNFNADLPHMLDPTKPYELIELSNPIGYSFNHISRLRLYVSNGNAIYSHYPEHIAQAAQNRLTAAQNRQIEEKENKKIQQTAIEEERSAERSAEQALLQLDVHQKLKLLEKNRIFVINEKNLTIHIQDEDTGNTSSEVNPLLNMLKNSVVVGELLKQCAEIGIINIQFNMGGDRNSYSDGYQKITENVASHLDMEGTDFRSFVIEVKSRSPLAFASCYSSKTAQAIADHGKSLHRFEMMANNKGILEAVRTVKSLKEKGNLQEAKLSPIETCWRPWRPETEKAVSELNDFMSQKHHGESSEGPSKIVLPTRTGFFVDPIQMLSSQKLNKNHHIESEDAAIDPSGNEKSNFRLG